MSFSIRTYGDPVLKSKAAEITEIDDKLVTLCDRMFDVMFKAPGIGLAAPQIGIQKRLFVYDIGDGEGVLINPEIVESDGEFMYEEGCLSIPGLYVEMLRPARVHVLMFDRMSPDQRKEAMAAYRRILEAPNSQEPQHIAFK
jgi:peptide deformylase